MAKASSLKGAFPLTDIANMVNSAHCINVRTASLLENMHVLRDTVE